MNLAKATRRVLALLEIEARIQRDEYGAFGRSGVSQALRATCGRQLDRLWDDYTAAGLAGEGLLSRAS